MKKSTAGLIRRTAKTVLRDCGGQMWFWNLHNFLKEKLNLNLRTDFVLNSLTRVGGGFEIHDNKGIMVISLRNFPKKKKEVKMVATSKRVRPKGTKLTVEEFVQRAIDKLGKNGKLHTVYSGFNGAFRAYFNQDPVEAVKKLVKEGKIFSRPVKGGVVISLVKAPSPGDEALKKMGLE
ncbi:MAG: hypothetical protein ACOZAL_02850 [Patescibacteria group bacterium]